MSKETYFSFKRDLLQCQKRPTTVSKETYFSVKRDLLQSQKRPITVSKETYFSVKRDLLQCQKRPITVSNRALTFQKFCSTDMSPPLCRHWAANAWTKETYNSVKRDLHQCQKRPITDKSSPLCRHWAANAFVTVLPLSNGQRCDYRQRSQLAARGGGEGGAGVFGPYSASWSRLCEGVVFDFRYEIRFHNF